jgi:hypothetical protein
MLAALTKVKRPHHQATGFDQAKERDAERDGELDRARDSKPMGRSTCNQTDIW